MARHALLVALFALLSTVCAGLHIPRFRPPVRTASSRRVTSGKDLLSRCKLNWRNATLDHFSWEDHGVGFTHFPQRYYVCDEYWKSEGKKGPIFFYLGNEADVTLYLNNTGLMWESAPEFGALIVFAEHRYYGKSKPAFKKLREHMGYLTTEQAMADYAELISELKHRLHAPDVAVVGFGGSYGGMLASWFRMKYPHLLDGAIAGSAPIWNFIGEHPIFNPNSFADGVTYDASAAAGSAPACIENARNAWRTMARLGATEEGREQIKQAAGLCENVPLDSEEAVLEFRNWMSNAWDYMAMGNFPYPSAYILNGDGLLPAFPVRVACSHLADPDLTGPELLTAMAKAVGVYYNHSGDVDCFDFGAGVNPDSDEDSNFWDYQYCTEMFMPNSRNGESDLYWSEPWDADATAEWCKEEWGVQPRRLWATVEWGGREIGAASNIVFSNGLYDPWHGGGVLKNISDTLQAVIIPEGAHHLDLMFSHPKDPPSVKLVRKFQKDQITRWIKDKHPPSYPTRQTSMRHRGQGVQEGCVGLRGCTQKAAASRR